MSFWIGDKVRLKKSGRIGLVSAILKDNKIKVQVEGKSIITSVSNVEVLPEKEFEYPDWVFGKEDLKSNKSSDQIDTTIDLHIEKLEPSMINASPAVILPFQVKQCRIFLQKNMQKRRSIVQVICGKGEGILKKEIIHLAQHEFNVRFIFEKNEGGMLEIWL